MKTVIKNEPTKRYIFLMDQAQKKASHFYTGTPKSISKYGLDNEQKITFISFVTSNGIEETYAKKFDCLADAFSFSEKIITFHLRP
jgi:hypothetical protein